MKLSRLQKKCLTEKGYDDPVNAAVTTTYFGKKYQEMAFPAGNYEALRVEIGSAKGHNWWGMLYPELAFWDAVHTVNEETKSERDGILLSEEEKSRRK